MLLYKFFSPQKYNLKALREGYLWFSKKESLNDPFDLLGHNLKQDYPSLFDNFHSEQQVQEIVDNIASCSFSETWYNVLMWAYYADSYRGWCLEFNDGFPIFSKNDNLSELQSVRYEIKYPNINDVFQLDEVYNGQPINHITTFDYTHTTTNHSINTDEMWNDGVKRLAYDLSMIKSSVWTDEREHRILLRTEERYGQAVKFNRGSLKSIIVGYRISQYKLKKIKRIAKSYGISVYMIKARDIINFKLEKEEIYNP